VAEKALRCVRLTPISCRARHCGATVLIFGRGGLPARYGERRPWVSFGVVVQGRRFCFNPALDELASCVPPPDRLAVDAEESRLSSRPFAPAPRPAGRSVVRLHQRLERWPQVFRRRLVRLHHCGLGRLSCEPHTQRLGDRPVARLRLQLLDLFGDPLAQHRIRAMCARKSIRRRR
jgi:hypothetical protein